VKGEQVFVVHNFYFYFYFCGQILSFFSTKRIGIFWEFFWGSVNMIISISCWKDSPNFYIKTRGAKKNTP
jgi:hypothetical protein